MAGMPAYAQEEKQQASAKDGSKLQALADSLLHTQKETTEALRTGVMNQVQQYDSLPRLSAVKRKPSSGTAWNNFATPRVSVDTSRVKRMKDSWMDKDWEFKTDGNNSSYTDVDPGSLSDLRSIFKTSSPTVRPGELSKDLPQLNAELPDKPSVEGLQEQQGTLKAQASNVLDNLQTQEGVFSKIRDLSGAKKIYSEKQLEQLRDSLGGATFDSLFQLASVLAKKEVSKEDFLDAIGSSLPGTSPLNNVNMDEQSLNVPGAETLSNMPASMSDLSKVKLPQSALSELPPLSGNEVSDRYLKLVDSLRDLNLKKERLTLEEKKIEDDVKAAIVQEKPKFLDKSYFEGIVGYLKDGDVTLLQASPSLGYHFTSSLSVGAGPSILLRAEDKQWSTSFGFRSFLKAELLRRRVYLQLEDDVKPGRIDAERTFRTPHSILLGGGGLIPLTKKMAINPSLLYRINNDQSAAPTSPWVFRLGISTIKPK